MMMCISRLAARILPPRETFHLSAPRRCTRHRNHPMHPLAQSSLYSSLPSAEEQLTPKEGTSLAQGHGTKRRAAIRPHSRDGFQAAPGYCQALGAALDGYRNHGGGR